MKTSAPLIEESISAKSFLSLMPAPPSSLSSLFNPMASISWTRASPSRGLGSSESSFLLKLSTGVTSYPPYFLSFEKSASYSLVSWYLSTIWLCNLVAIAWQTSNAIIWTPNFILLLIYVLINYHSNFIYLFL